MQTVNQPVVTNLRQKALPVVENVPADEARRGVRRFRVHVGRQRRPTPKAVNHIAKVPGWFDGEGARRRDDVVPTERNFQVAGPEFLVEDVLNNSLVTVWIGHSCFPPANRRLAPGCFAGPLQHHHRLAELFLRRRGRSGVKQVNTLQLIAQQFGDLTEDASRTNQDAQIEA